MECVEIMLCRLCTDDFPVNFIEGYQREPGSGSDSSPDAAGLLSEQ